MKLRKYIISLALVGCLFSETALAGGTLGTSPEIMTLILQGATSAPKARSEEGLTGQAPVPNTELIDKEIDGGRNSREGVPNVW